MDQADISNVPPGRRRLEFLSGGTFVRLAVILTIAMVVATTALIGLRWVRVPEPTTAILIYGDPSLSGAKVSVVPVGDTDSQSVELTLDESNKYQTPIYRFPGLYRVSVEWRGQKVLNDEPVSIDRMHGIAIELPPVLTLIGDKTIADVAITGAGATAPITLNEVNKYRSDSPFPPGKWRITFTRAGTPVEQEITIAPHEAKEMDLRPH